MKKGICRWTPRAASEKPLYLRTTLCHMTVHCFVPGSTDVSIPVATEAAFDKYWRPGAEALGLSWVLQLDIGVVVREAETRHIVAELSHLEEWMRAQRTSLGAAWFALRQSFRRLSRSTKKRLSGDLCEPAFGIRFRSRSAGGR
jgi:hypothetical protein